MKEKKTSDYNIISINYYASNYLMKKYYGAKDGNGHLPTQHHERSKLYNYFKWEFIEKITGLNHGDWYQNYMFETDECAYDYIQETTGIIVQRGHEGWIKYFIPKSEPELFDWIKLNVNLPYKIMKRASIPWGLRDDSKLQWRREESANYTVETTMLFSKNKRI